MSNLGWIGAGFLIVVLLPIIGVFIILPVVLIILFMVLVWPALFIIYLFTKSPMLANILGPTFFLFMGMVLGAIALVLLGVMAI